jgi:hypothetical protein
MDKDLKALRNSRWEKTFAEKSQVSDCEEDDNNRKATIVIEHIIQASDVAHTMQHWYVVNPRALAAIKIYILFDANDANKLFSISRQIYRKWNEKLYEELYNAYSEGRIEKDRECCLWANPLCVSVCVVSYPLKSRIWLFL